MKNEKIETAIAESRLRQAELIAAVEQNANALQAFKAAADGLDRAKRASAIADEVLVKTIHGEGLLDYGQ
jgi:hypothetical protein